MDATTTKVTMTCAKCKSTYEITLDNKKRRERKGTPNFCPVCMAEYMLSIQKGYFKKLSKEEKKKYIDKRNWYSRASEEEKKAHAQKTIDQLAKRTEEEQKAVNQKNSEGLKRHWETQTEEQKAARVQGMREGNRRYWESMSPEERSMKARAWFDKLSPEEQEETRRVLSEQMTAYNASLPQAEKRRRVDNMNEFMASMSPDQKADMYRRTHIWYHSLTPEEKLEHSMSKREWYNHLSPDQKRDFIRRSLSTGKTNSLTKKFEDAFNASHLVQECHLEKEVVMSATVTHSWDYGIYRNNDNELLMLVDLDGSFYHADNCDYNGVQSREEYDERRSLSIPEGSTFKTMIVQEGNLRKCVDELVKVLFTDYDEYVDRMFKLFRSMPFPEPRYSDVELIRSYSQLLGLQVTNPEHGNLSLNNRVGDRLIQHFHPSIYHASRKGCKSPYDAWHDDGLLRECIKNRTLYQTHLNPNKILQGFNISRIAPKVSVFSAARAKILIGKYLSDYDVIVDPFSGFSGRMLGAVSLGKKYIGRDGSPIHVMETTRMIDFLRGSGFNIDAEVTWKMFHGACAEYPFDGDYAIITCPPYWDTEKWIGVKESIYTCDEWIGDIMYHFKGCRKFVFIVDKTNVYRDWICDVIENRSYNGHNREYVIVREF